MAARRPSTRPQISREFIEAQRRRRFVEATAEILHEFGRPGATTTNIVRLAGGSRNSFYEVFGGVEDCIAHGIGLAEAELFASPEPPAGEGGWAEEVEAVIAGFYGAVAGRPLLAELLLIHAAASRDDAGRAAYRQVGARFAPLLTRGAAESRAAGRRPPPEALAECLSRAVVALAAERVRDERVEALPAESAPMAVLVVGYYLGADLPAANEDSEALAPRP